MLEYFIIAIIAFFVFLWYMGIFHKVVVDEDKFTGGYYMYKNCQGHINNYPKTMKQMIANARKEGIDTHKLQFMSIVYDDPYNLADPDQFRTSYGFLMK